MKKIIFLFALFLCYLSGDSQIIYRSSDYLFKNRVSVGAQSETATPTSVWFRVGDSASNRGMLSPTSQQRDSLFIYGSMYRGTYTWDLFEGKPYWWDGDEWITFQNSGDTMYLVNGAPFTADTLLVPSEEEIMVKSFVVDSDIGLIPSAVTDSTFGVSLDSSVLFPLIRATIPGGVSYTFENGVFNAGGNVIKADTLVLVTWAFRQKLADSLAAVILAANGLQKVSGVIELGGALTKNTTVTPSTFELNVATNSLGVTQSNVSGINLANSTAAAAGAQQISPALRFRGNGWKTNATAASQTVDVRNYLLPVQGTTTPTASLVWEYSYNGGAYADLFKVTSLGLQHTGSGGGGGISLSSAAPAANTFFYPSTITFGNTSNSSATNVQFNNSTGFQQTSGETIMFRISNGSITTGFNPPSGTATHSVLKVDGYIDQDPSATGISRGVYISTIIENAADWRALDIDYGTIYLNNTITPGGTTGNQTIDKASGTVNFAAGASSLTVTNSWVNTSSIVLAVVRTNDATAYIKNVVCNNGNFVITLGAAATAETSVGFVVFNSGPDGS